MRTLAVDCATEACSVALFDGARLIAGEYRVLGRGHAEHLMPIIASMPGKGQADRIAVSLGPGSFTGVRIGMAATRALALAWGAEILGYPSLALVAAMARAQSGDQPVSVAMTGGHGEWFVQNFGANGLPEAGLLSLPPDRAAEYASHAIVAGTQAEALAATRGHGQALALWPDARQFAALPDALLTNEITPLYGRAPDARLPGEVAR